MAFAWDRHRDELFAPRELLDRDRAVLDDWREREQRALDGKGWDTPRPLAVGSAARELVRRAEAGGG
jgi:predicted phage gp36 major capsid-like protein